MPYIQQNKGTIIKEYSPRRDKYTTAVSMCWAHEEKMVEPSAVRRVVLATGKSAT